MELLEAALSYAKRGWPVFPTNAIKEPLVEGGVTAATTDPAKIKAWWARYPRANVAVDVGGAGMMVIDLDPGHDLKELEKNVGPLPKTLLQASTPRGGRHLFFALAPGELVANSASKLANAVDVRSFHGYVLVAPSRTADGAYTWEGEGKPAYRTDEMVRLANIAKEKSKDRDNWLIEADLPENVAGAVNWLKTQAKVAVQGQGGDNMAYATAAHMKSFGISQELAFDLIWEHWNPRCQPPWSADQVEHLETKVINGYSYNTSPPGNVTPAYHVARNQALFKPIARTVSTGCEITSGRFRFVDRAGMGAIRAPEWLIKDFLPSGAYGILFGASGTFKSFIALDVGMSVATGVSFPWQGCWPEVNASGKVLITLGEGRPEFAKRINAWEQTHWNSRKVDNLVLGDPVPLVSEEWQPFIDGALALSPDGYKLVVLDTVGRSMQGLNENAQENASNFTRLVEAIQKNLGAAVLAVHHTGHEAGERARGSSVFGADADTIVRAQRNGKDMVVTLTMTKQKDAPEWDKPKLIRLSEVKLDMKATSLVAMKPADNERPTPTAKTEDAPADQTVLKTLDSAVLAVLASNKLRAWTSLEIAEAVAMRPEIGISSKTLRNRHLVVLREDSTSRANGCYDALTKRWKFRDKA